VFKGSFHLILDVFVVHPIQPSEIQDYNLENN